MGLSSFMKDLPAGPETARAPPFRTRPKGFSVHRNRPAGTGAGDARKASEPASETAPSVHACQERLWSKCAGTRSFNSLPGIADGADESLAGDDARPRGTLHPRFVPEIPEVDPCSAPVDGSRSEGERHRLSIAVSVGRDLLREEGESPTVARPARIEERLAAPPRTTEERERREDDEDEHREAPDGGEQERGQGHGGWR